MSPPFFEYLARCPKIECAVSPPPPKSQTPYQFSCQSSSTCISECGTFSWACYSISSPHFFMLFTFSPPLSSILISLESKNLVCKSWSEHPKTLVLEPHGGHYEFLRHHLLFTWMECSFNWSAQKHRFKLLSRSQWPLWNPMATIWIFEVLIDVIIKYKNLFCES